MSPLEMALVEMTLLEMSPLEKKEKHVKKKRKELKPQIDLKAKPVIEAGSNSTASPLKSIRIDQPLPIPKYAKEALQRLSDHGHSAYLVGGCVRDFLLGLKTKDYDIATDATPDQLCKLFPRAIPVGKNFGVIKVPTDADPPLLEIATFRQDLEYEDFRRPVGVVFSSPLQDAKRRDFTLNALFYDPKTGSVLDYVGGYADLKKGLIKAIGVPEDRFREDALRLLRAIRFQSRFQFAVDRATLEAVSNKARLILKVSSERIRDELSLMWSGPNPELSLAQLSAVGLLQHILPEVEALKKVGRWEHVLKTLRILHFKYPNRSFRLSWATVLHDVGRAVVEPSKHFKGHEVEAERIALRVGERLKFSSEDSKVISSMVGDQLRFKDVFQMRESTLQRFVRDAYFEDLLRFHQADALATDGNLAFYEFCKSRFDAFKNSPTPESYKLIDGNDLIQLGFSPGPEFSQILRAVEDLALERKLLRKEDALEYIVKHFVN